MEEEGWLLGTPLGGEAERGAGGLRKPQAGSHSEPLKEAAARVGLFVGIRGVPRAEAGSVLGLQRWRGMHPGPRLRWAPYSGGGGWGSSPFRNGEGRAPTRRLRALQADHELQRRQQGPPRVRAWESHKQ